MKVAFRCDASLLIGTGHVMRCLSFAEFLRARGHDVVFVVRHILPALQQLLLDKDFSLVHLPATKEPYSAAAKYGHWLGVSEETDAAQTLMMINDIDWLVVDHYGIGCDWENAVAERIKHVLAIDDLVNRPHVCQLVVDPNVARVATVESDSTVLSGADYAFIRSEFLNIRAQAEIRMQVDTVLLFFGGVDSKNMTMMALQAITPLLDAGAIKKVVVVLGQASPNRAEVETYCVDPAIELHIQTNNMAELMTQADVIIATASSANWERCVTGTPALLCVVADNQIAIAQEAARARSGINLGLAEDLTAELISNALKPLLDLPELVSTMSKNAFACCDGEGCRRVCNWMEAAL